MSAAAISRFGGPKPVHVSLFSGVGMTDLAAEQEGFQTLATAEINAWNRELLAKRLPSAAYHFPTVQAVGSSSLRYRTGFLGRVDLLSGGFPCQDASDAGTKAGLYGSRTGLWVEFERIMAELRPSYVIGENVASLRSRGLNKILFDMWALGYDVRWECIPAAYVGANHLRDRCWIMARNRDTTSGLQHWPLSEVRLGDISTQMSLLDRLPRAGRMIDGTVYAVPPLTTTKNARNGRKLLPTPTKSDGTGGPGTTPKRTGGKNLRTVAKELTGNGRLDPQFVEHMMGLPFGWTDPQVPNSALRPHTGWNRYTTLAMTTFKNVPHRSQRIQALGNGLVPQVARVALRILLND